MTKYRTSSVYVVRHILKLHQFYVVLYRLSFDGIFSWLASMCHVKNHFFVENFQKTRNFNFWNRYNSRSSWSISNPKIVLKSVDHKLSFDSLFGAEFKISKWRNVIGRNFFDFFCHFFFLKNIKTDWLSSILM